jgi:hypothetical protein
VVLTDGAVPTLEPQIGGKQLEYSSRGTEQDGVELALLLADERAERSQELVDFLRAQHLGKRSGDTLTVDSPTANEATFRLLLPCRTRCAKR